MWTATCAGFFSAVQHRDDHDQMMVRARSHADLVNLLAIAEAQQPQITATIVETGRADYPYRVTVSRDEWKVLIGALIDGIDYDNFKNAVAKTNPTRSHGAYMRVWTDLHTIEREPGALVGKLAKPASSYATKGWTDPVQPAWATGWRPPSPALAHHGRVDECTGQTYDVNPDAPEEGTDVVHDAPCPTHRIPATAGWLATLPKPTKRLGKVARRRRGRR